MKPEGIIIVGTGRLACGCLETSLSRLSRVVCVEPEKRSFSPLEALCRARGIPYHLITQRPELSRFFLSVREPTLVVSAYNGFLFPKAVLEKPNLEIVNFHNSLLPRHRGRNAPSWTIFEMDKFSGITWHELGEQIDTGSILWQETIEVPSNITAVALTLKSLELGAEAFNKLLPSLLEGVFPPCPIPTGQVESFHRSADVPNDGILDLGWCAPKAHAFLRALDYGKLSVFPAPRVRLLGKELRVKSYAFHAEPTCESCDVLLSFDGKRLFWRQPNAELTVQCE